MQKAVLANQAAEDQPTLPQHGAPSHIIRTIGRQFAFSHHQLRNNDKDLARQAQKSGILSPQSPEGKMFKRRLGLAAALLCAMLCSTGVRAQSPITIGFSMSLTGGLAPNGKAALLAMQIWEADVNARGGLLGRAVKLIYYDDQSNPALVPGIYTKLLDVDRTDLVVSSYATNMIAPAMPVIIQHDHFFLGLLGLAINNEFRYPRYFSIAPTGGAEPKQSFSAGFIAVAMAQQPRPQTIALVGADAEFPHNALEGARALAEQAKLRVVYDKTYPPGTTDYTPIIRAIQATSPDLVFVASYPPDSVGIVRAANEVGLKTGLFGGGMVGLQATAIKSQLGPLLNGVTDYDFWLPIPSLATPEAKAFLDEYQAKSAAGGVDLLGYYLPPFAYSRMQVLADAVTATQSIDSDKLAEYCRSHTFKTIVGNISFGPGGEWSDARVMEVQFQNVHGHDVQQFKDLSAEVVLWPSTMATGKPVYPYDGAKH